MSQDFDSTPPPDVAEFAKTPASVLAKLDDAAVKEAVTSMAAHEQAPQPVAPPVGKAFATKTALAQNLLRGWRDQKIKKKPNGAWWYHGVHDALAVLLAVSSLEGRPAGQNIAVVASVWSASVWQLGQPYEKHGIVSTRPWNWDADCAEAFCACKQTALSCAASRYLEREARNYLKFERYVVRWPVPQVVHAHIAPCKRQKQVARVARQKKLSPEAQAIEKARVRNQIDRAKRLQARFAKRGRAVSLAQLFLRVGQNIDRRKNAIISHGDTAR